jgi:hypothetical protein
LRCRIGEQLEIAEGKKLSGGDDSEGLYVNPLYYFALKEVADRYGGAASDPGGGVSTGRSIAETVAQATLDVVHPIAPLGPTGEVPFDPFDVGPTDLDPVELDELASNFEHDDDAYDRLLKHSSELDDEVLTELGLDGAGDWSPNLIDKLFITCLEALDTLDTEMDVTDLERDALRRRLVQEIHGVDIGDESVHTVLDSPSPLLDQPRRVDKPSSDQNLIEVESDPLAKILIESFDEHGAFGAVIYPEDGDNIISGVEMVWNRQLNWNVIEAQVDDHPVVPEFVDTYQQLWEYYYLGQALVNHLIDQREPYLVSKFREVYETPDQANLVIEHETSGVGSSALGDTQYPATQAVKSTSPNHEQAASATDRGEASLSSEDGLIKWDLDWTVNRLRAAADAVEMDLGTPASNVPYEDIECPFCEFFEGTCGADGCVTERKRSQYESILPELVGALLEHDSG